MCGICGLFALDGQLDPVVAGTLSSMTDAVRHRGPDAEGHFTDAVAALGHRRLSIIDVTTGGQPICNEDRSCWIVFNGEIYNHRVLRHDLVARGHVFHTQSDTEAIVHAYEEYGTACVEHLEGMFAFAIYDQRNRVLFAARDRLGKKPFFFAVLRNVLHFGSEIKAFFPSPLWDDELDLSALEGYLSLGYFVAPGTIYRAVSKLEPGCWLRAANGRVETHRYWDVEEFDTDRRPEADVLNELEGLLEEVVEERLESEVPLGAFLSGGIDSGLVVSYMANHLPGRLVTASVGFGGDPRSELQAAALTAARFQSQHHPHVVEAELREVLDPVVSAFDEPFADPSAIPTWYVSKIARQHVTVALSGDGGDETFAGYDFRYVPHEIEARLRRLLPGRAGRAFARGMAAAWPRRPGLPRPLRLGTMWDNLSHDACDAYYADLCLLKPPRARRLLGKDQTSDPRTSPVYEAVTGPYRRCPSPSAVQRAQYADLKVYMPNAPLVKVDRMAMQHALEVRCPLLDRRVVEFAFRLPTGLKMARLHGKHLLRSLAGRRLPPGLAALPKQGFNAPVAEWLAGPYADMFEAEVLAPGAGVSSLIDTRCLRTWFDEHKAGRANHWYPLWAAWILERWHAGQARRQPA